ncbi:hypothetical protein PVL29_019571 [Vitis rotundifolia]|uniref:DUF3475 domain-containing protein n=1 Tax=Vitis rotundifolia TaxID=103349 RepID=A0AA38Z1C4_VITRO|nr:hypothetical protein PVL29_019571 [Vitis rotundifolia]
MDSILFSGVQTHLFLFYPSDCSSFIIPVPLSYPNKPIPQTTSHTHYPFSIPFTLNTPRFIPYKLSIFTYLFLTHACRDYIPMKLIMPIFFTHVVNLWNGLSDRELDRVTEEILNLLGIRKLVSDDDGYLMGFALAKIIEDLEFVMRSAAKLGKRCTSLRFQHFEYYFGDSIQNDVA